MQLQTNGTIQTTIIITQEQYDKLILESFQTKRSNSEIIRALLDKHQAVPALPAPAAVSK